MDYWGGGR